MTGVRRQRAPTSPWRGEVAPKAREGVEVRSSSALSPHPGSLTRSDPPPPGEGEKPLALLELRPITGRTHQLRVHCQASGFPIFGDPIYGTAPRFGGPGLHLHARSVTVPLYPRKPPILVEAPVPAHMWEQVSMCGMAVEADPPDS